MGTEMKVNQLELENADINSIIDLEIKSDKKKKKFQKAQTSINDPEM